MQSSVRMSRSVLVLLVALLALLSSAAVQHASAVAPPTDATLSASNSSSLSFSVGIPAGTDATSLRVQVQTAVNGNTTESSFPLTAGQAGPVVVDIANLNAGSGYVVYFYLDSAGNGSSTATKTNPQVSYTLSVGPAITSFFAKAPAGSTSNTDFAAGCTFTIAFDKDTNKPDVSSKAAIDALFRYQNGNLGSDYTGVWTTAKVLTVTVRDAGQSSPPLGSTFLYVIGALKQADLQSDVSRAGSPPLTGSFASITTSYFVPLDASNNQVSDMGDYSAWNAQSPQDTPRRIPLELVFPSSGVRVQGYGLLAQLMYPKPDTADAALFQLQGDNFTSGIVVQEGAPSVPGVVSRTIIFNNAQLSKALAGLSLVPPAGFLGFTSVQVQLWDRNNNALLSTVYTNIEFVGASTVAIPKLSVDGSSGSSSPNFLEDPAGTISTYKVPLIAALCSVVGVFLLAALGFLLYRKYKGGRDARDFEGQPLADHVNSDRAASVPAGGDGAATRRFYYDAKV